jgi:signal transduction histidine kinase
MMTGGAGGSRVGVVKYGRIKARLGRLLRGDPAFPKLPERMRRPAIFALLFWSVLAVTCVSYALSLNREGRGFGLLPVVLAVVLVAAWTALPWDPRVGNLRKLAAPVFLLGVFALQMLTGSVWAFGLYAIPFANGVFLFGFGWGIAYAAAILPFIFVNYLVLLADLYPGREGAAVQASLLTVFWVPVVVFVVGVCAAIVEAVRRREEARGLLAELKAAHAELEIQAERSRELAISGERARMAREVHDSVGHHLTAIHLQLQNAERFRERDPERSWVKVGEAKELALSSLSEVRRSVRALRPPALAERSGPGALAALARSFDGAGPEVRFVVEGEERRLPEHAELVLYRAMQEGLTNAVRHSGARNVLATLTFGDEGVRLVVADDGGGTNGTPPEGGFGLAGLGERVKDLGGSLSAGDRSEGGFAFEVELSAGRG